MLTLGIQHWRKRSNLMRFYTTQHPFDCGIALHARRLDGCIVHHAGAVLLHRNMPTAPEPLLQASAPYREGLGVAVECMFPWYGLADLCAQEGLAFVLGPALSLQAMHGGPAKTDKLDSHQMAVLLRGGLRPPASGYPAPLRATRDRLRRRLPLTRQRAALF